MDRRSVLSASVALLALLAVAAVDTAAASRPGRQLYSQAANAQGTPTGTAPAHHRTHTSGTQPTSTSGTRRHRGPSPAPADADAAAAPPPTSSRHSRTRSGGLGSAADSGGGQCTPGTPPAGTYAGEQAEGGVGDYSKTCADANNVGCAPCKLWYMGKVKNGDKCQTGTAVEKANCANGFMSYGHLVLPPVAIRGIEEVTSSVPAGAEIFAQAWETNSNPEADKALVCNSANYRTEHQMHVHMGKIDPVFQKNCIVPNINAPTTWASAKLTSCQVNEWKNTHCTSGTGCHGGWEIVGTKPAKVIAITISSLKGVWKEYASAAGQRPGGTYKTGVMVTHVPNSTSKWLMLMFSSESSGIGGVGDHEVLKEY